MSRRVRSFSVAAAPSKYASAFKKQRVEAETKRQKAVRKAKAAVRRAWRALSKRQRREVKRLQRLFCVSLRRAMAILSAGVDEYVSDPTLWPSSARARYDTYFSGGGSWIGSPVWHIDYVAIREASEAPGDDDEAGDCVVCAKPCDAHRMRCCGARVHPCCMYAVYVHATARHNDDDACATCALRTADPCELKNPRFDSDDCCSSDDDGSSSSDDDSDDGSSGDTSSSSDEDSSSSDDDSSSSDD